MRLLACLIRSTKEDSFMREVLCLRSKYPSTSLHLANMPTSRLLQLNFASTSGYFETNSVGFKYLLSAILVSFNLVFISYFIRLFVRKHFLLKISYQKAIWNYHLPHRHIVLTQKHGSSRYLPDDLASLLVYQCYSNE